MTRTASASLEGSHCLVLRPRDQADSLSSRLCEAGATVTHCPTIEIEPITVPSSQLSRAEKVDWLVFISPNAVTCGLKAFAAAGLDLPAGARIVAVGAGTANALREAGVRVDVQPEHGGGSDALLTHRRLQALAGQRAVIVRGEGGRERLAQGLTERGARVEYIEVYRRRPAALADPEALLAGWRCNRQRVTLVTSVTGWQNLLVLLDAATRRALFDGGLVTVSQRIAETARVAGHRGPVAVADEPGVDAMVEAVCSVRRQLTGTDS